ncbi:MAG: long-chain fatty acid--CoA ligase [Chlorobi bacterium]|nr:long-chain fatty acid--CoA ligase [Chlorobiota bacterium]
MRTTQAPAMKISRLFDIPDHLQADFPHKDILAWKNFGRWKRYDTDTYYRYVKSIGRAALKKGFRKGDTFATLIRNNRPEWNFVDMGLMQIGMIHVPLHPGISTGNLRYILSKTEVKILFVHDRKTLEQYKEVIHDIPSLKIIYSFSRVRRISHWRVLVSESRKPEKQFAGMLDIVRKSIKPEDPATIVFTSGTTGNPKGVVLSHANLVSNILASSGLQPLDHRHRVLSFLPLSHIYERTSNYVFQLKGTTIYYAESYLHVRDNLQEIRPHGITVVPRFLEKIEDAVIARGQKLKGIQGRIYFRAIQLHLYYRSNHRNNVFFRLKQFIFGVLVYRKIRKMLGGNICFIGCGGAPLSLLTEKFFWTIGLPVFQGYGLTETSPLIALNHLPKENVRLGTVGPAIPGVRIKLAQDGEILAKGPGIMKHYYRDEAFTRNTFDHEGWFRTGDLGRFIDERFLKITGRKKELFKTSYGKYIVPQVIEGKFRRSPFISNSLVFGEGQKFPGIIIQPDFTYIRNWLREQGRYAVSERAKIILLPEVRKQIEKEVERINRTLDEHERIRKLHLIPDLWTIASGDLSASYKLKRHHLINRYRKLIEKTYL